MSEHFEVAVIGGGPGGYVAAQKAASLSAKVALIEKEHLGGTCLNYGCIPSKALLASAERLHQVRSATDLGIDVAGTVTANWPKIQARKDRILTTQRAGLKTLLAGRKVTVFKARATLQGPGNIVISKNAEPADKITASKVILAMGSAPATIPGWPADRQRVCTSDEALHWKTLPRKLLVVGGGVIGCELSCALHTFGVEVTIVEVLPRILPQMEEQLAASLARIFSARGIRCLAGRRIEDLELTETGVRARLDNGDVLETDRVLVATGRRPNTADIGLHTVGLATERGFVRVNDQMETQVAGYYCIGDANGRCLLAHAASAQGLAAAENALGAKRAVTAPVSNCVYTFPEIASAGLTSEEAGAQRIPFFAGSFPLRFLGKAQACGEVEGFVKVLRHRETGRLLGVHLLGHNATECIAAAGALLHQKVTVTELAEVIFAHPTMSEAIKEAGEDSLHLGLHQLPRKIQRVVAAVGLETRLQD